MKTYYLNFKKMKEISQNSELEFCKNDNFFLKILIFFGEFYAFKDRPFPKFRESAMLVLKFVILIRGITK